MIRCLAHIAVDQLDASASGGGECGACVQRRAEERVRGEERVSRESASERIAALEADLGACRVAAADALGHEIDQSTNTHAGLVQALSHWSKQLRADVIDLAAQNKKLEAAMREALTYIRFCADRDIVPTGEGPAFADAEALVAGVEVPDGEP